MKRIFTRKNIAIFLVWFFINLIVLTLSLSRDDFRVRSDFWPFTDLSLLRTYDITEFLFYVFTPILIVYVYLTFKEKEDEK